MPSVSIVDKLISQNRTGNQMNLFLNTSRQKKNSNQLSHGKNREFSQDIIVCTALK